MTPRLSGNARPLLALATILTSGCASTGMSASEVLSTVITVGGAISSRSGGTGGTGDSRPTSSPSSSRRFPNSPAPSATVSRVLTAADQYVGVRYTWGGNTPQSGFDCSGFTKYVFAKQGIQLPRTSREQARAGQSVALYFDALLPGDILLFAEKGEAISHVAIYVGDGQIIHSSQGYHGVNYLDLNTTAGDWYVQNMVAARRLTSNGKSLVQSLQYLTLPPLKFEPPDRAP